MRRKTELNVKEYKYLGVGWYTNEQSNVKRDISGCSGSNNKNNTKKQYELYFYIEVYNKMKKGRK